MVSDSTVLVLLSAYNGARYIGEQLESIRAQTFRDWRLLIRDDGSSDQTPSILESFAASDPRIEVLSDTYGNVGPFAGFGLLLSAAAQTNARFVFLSDQDDVWIPTKMATQLATLRSAEKKYGATHPILTHSDLEVVGEKLEPVHHSFREFQGFSHDVDDPLQTLLIHSGMMGCTMAMNRALLDVAVPLPAGSSHDWWVGLCAAATGTVLPSSERMVRYRQHGANTIGAHPKRAFFSRIVQHPFDSISEAFVAFDVGVMQSHALKDRLEQIKFGDAATLRRVDRYTDVYSSRSFRSRIRSLRESGAKPRRSLSRVFLLGIVAVFPRWKRKRQRV